MRGRTAEGRKTTICVFSGAAFATSTLFAIVACTPPHLETILSKSEFLTSAYLACAITPGVLSGFALGEFITNRMPNLRRKRLALKNIAENENKNGN